MKEFKSVKILEQLATHQDSVIYNIHFCSG